MGFCRWPIALLAAAGCSFSVPAGTGGGGGGGGGDDQPPIIDAPPDEPDAPWLADWTYRRKITIHHEQVAAALTDFPVALVLPVSPPLAFTSDDAITPLAHEVEVAGDTELTAWVKVPALSDTADTVLYVYYGVASAPTTGAANVWTDHFHAVYHLQQDPGPGTAGSIADASGNGHDGTPESHFDSTDLLLTGKVGPALQFNGSNTCVSIASFDVGNQFTISMWANMNSVSQIRTLFTNSQDGSNTNGFRLFMNTNGSSDRKLDLETGNGGSTNSAVTPGAIVTAGQWQHVAAIVDRGAGTATLVVDGTVVNTGDTSIRNDFTTAHDMEIGRMETNNAFDGVIDEVEIASTLRTLEWLRTAHNNQGSPADFAAIGAQELH